MTLTRQELKKSIVKEYPKVWLKESEEWGDFENCLITGENSIIIYKDPEDNEEYEIPVIDYYNEFGLHPDGVYKEFTKFIELAGWYTEFYDCGTLIIAPRF